MLYINLKVCKLWKNISTPGVVINMVRRGSFHSKEKSIFLQKHTISGTMIQISALQYAAIKSILMECIKCKSSALWHIVFYSQTYSDFNIVKISCYFLYWGKDDNHDLLKLPLVFYLIGFSMVIELRLKYNLRNQVGGFLRNIKRHERTNIKFLLTFKWFLNLPMIF